MTWLFAVLGLVVIVVIGLVLIGRETARLAARVRPAVFDLGEAVDFIADRLSAPAQARLSLDDVRWVLLADADLLESATADPTEGAYPWSRPAGPATDPADPGTDGDPADRDAHTVDEDHAVARILGVAEATGRDLADEDVAEVLDRRADYLAAIGAVGPEVDDAQATADAPAPTDPAGSADPDA